MKSQFLYFTPQIGNYGGYSYILTSEELKSFDERTLGTSLWKLD